MKLTDAEVKNVRAALKYLRRRAGGWGPLAVELGVSMKHIEKILYSRPIGPAMAFAVARYANVTPDDLLDGKFPGPLACPNCGHALDEFLSMENRDAH